MFTLFCGVLRMEFLGIVQIYTAIHSNSLSASALHKSCFIHVKLPTCTRGSNDSYRIVGRIRVVVASYTSYQLLSVQYETIDDASAVS